MRSWGDQISARWRRCFAYMTNDLAAQRLPKETFRVVADFPDARKPR
jgi:hypothetical protein